MKEIERGEVESWEMDYAIDRIEKVTGKLNLPWRFISTEDIKKIDRAIKWLQENKS